MAAVKSDRAQTEIDVKERARELGNRIQTTSGQASLVRLRESRFPATSRAGCRQVSGDGPGSGWSRDGPGQRTGAALCQARNRPHPKPWLENAAPGPDFAPVRPKAVRDSFRGCRHPPAGRQAGLSGRMATSAIDLAELFRAAGRRL